MLIGKKEGWDNKSENRRPGEWEEEKTLELRHRDMGMEQMRTKRMMKQEKEESRNEGGIWRREFGNKANNRRPGEWKEEKTLELRHRDMGMEQIRTKQMMKQEKEESRNEGGSEEQSLETKQRETRRMEGGENTGTEAQR